MVTSQNNVIHFRDILKNIMGQSKIAIIGTVGVPARYGGFETLVENLILYHKESCFTSELSVWCSGKYYSERLERYHTASLKYIELQANGLQSIPYDVLSMIQAVKSQHTCLLILGVSGALALPFVRLFSKARIVTNIDGLEWKRNKWGFFASTFLKFSESLAVRFSHEIIADNEEISNYVLNEYGVSCNTIAYGGDHALQPNEEIFELDLPSSYCLALCRIEPENNVMMILEAFSKTQHKLVFVGNWDNSNYGARLKKKYACYSNINILDPVYDKNTLYNLRLRASTYIHGHSAGGTNPALVEMMHFGINILAFECNFNKYSTDGKALYFKNVENLKYLLLNLDKQTAQKIGRSMKKTADSKYTWDKVAKEYFDLLN
jgi:glycosyltransferase involved in cell wall biosynthesis